MRVIGGEFRSRLLKSVPGIDTRPTPDRLREALFNVLAPRIEGVVFADLYAGTGAVGIEALSRGAARAVFVESHRVALRVIKENIAALELEDRASVVNARATAILPDPSWDIAFLDPPYRLERDYAAALEKLGAKPPRLAAIVQHDVRLKLADSYGMLRCVRRLRQGDNVLSFFEGS